MSDQALTWNTDIKVHLPLSHHWSIQHSKRSGTNWNCIGRTSPSERRDSNFSTNAAFNILARLIQEAWVMLTGEFGCSRAASFLQSSLSTAISSCYKAAESRVFFLTQLAMLVAMAQTRHWLPWSLTSRHWALVQSTEVFFMPWEDLLIVWCDVDLNILKRLQSRKYMNILSISVPVAKIRPMILMKP